MVDTPFTHSSVRGHLGCFSPLALVHNAAMNEYFFGSLLSVLVGAYPEVALLAM